MPSAYAVILLDISDERQRVGDGTSGMSRENFDELLIERTIDRTFAQRHLLGTLRRPSQ